MALEGSLQRSQTFTAETYPEQFIPNHTLTPCFLRSILILSSYLCLGLPSNPISSGLLTKTKYAFVILQYVTHRKINYKKKLTCYTHLSLPDFFTPKNVLVKGMDTEAPHCVIFHSLLLFPIS
jgi:hypothetical protein